MTAKGHMTLASALAYPAVLAMKETGYENEMLVAFYGVVMFFSIFPDIDEPRSKIGRMFLPLSLLVVVFGWLMKTLFKMLLPGQAKNIDLALGHRGLTHYMLFPLLFMVPAMFVQSNLALLFVAASLGILFHIAGDMLTKGGVKNFFFPFFLGTKTALLPYPLRFVTNSPTEYMVIFALFFLNVLLYGVFLPAEFGFTG